MKLNRELFSLWHYIYSIQKQNKKTSYMIMCISCYQGRPYQNSIQKYHQLPYCLRITHSTAILHVWILHYEQEAADQMELTLHHHYGCIKWLLCCTVAWMYVDMWRMILEIGRYAMPWNGHEKWCSDNFNAIECCFSPWRD